MEPHLLKAVLLWCLGINYAVLLIWFGVFVFAHDAIHRLHFVFGSSIHKTEYAVIGHEHGK